MILHGISIDGKDYALVKITSTGGLGEFCISYTSKEPLPLEHETWDNTDPHNVTRKYKPLIINGEYYGILPKETEQ